MPIQQRVRRRGGVVTRKAWKAFGIAGLCASGVYFLLPGAGAKDFGYSVVGVSSVVAVVWGARRRPIGERKSWYSIALGNLCFVLGDSVYDLYQFVLHRPTPFPSAADALYLTGYPFLIVGVV